MQKSNLVIIFELYNYYVVEFLLKLKERNRLMKDISVVIPCYNVEKYIDDCVESLVNQTFGINRMELIFVDDASTDGTLKKLALWESKYPDSILVVSLLENSRQGTARNVGMEYATGEYLGFVDSDDYVDITMYEKLYQVHQENDVNYVVCSRWNERPNGQKDRLGPREDGILDVTTYKYPNARLNMEAPSGIVQKLYNREWLMSLNVWFPDKLAYEDNYWGSIVNYYTEKVGLVKEPLYFYRFNESSTTQTQNSMKHLERLKIELMKLEELKKRNLFSLYQENIEFDFLKLYFSNSIIMFLTKFNEFPEGLIKEMQQTTRMNFPNWRENPLLGLYKDVNAICQMIDYPFESGNRQEVLCVYAHYKNVYQL